MTDRPRRPPKRALDEAMALIKGRIAVLTDLSNMELWTTKRERLAASRRAARLAGVIAWMEGE